MLLGYFIYVVVEKKEFLEKLLATFPDAMGHQVIVARVSH